MYCQSVERLECVLWTHATLRVESREENSEENRCTLPNYVCKCINSKKVEYEIIFKLPPPLPQNEI